MLLKKYEKKEGVKKVETRELFEKRILSKEEIAERVLNAIRRGKADKKLLKSLKG